MQSPVTSEFCRAVLDTMTAWHILEIKQNLAQQSSDHNASLTEQLVVERLQRYGSDKLQGSGSPKLLTIVLDQHHQPYVGDADASGTGFSNFKSASFSVSRRCDRLSVIELHRTEELSFSFPEGRRHSIEPKDLLSNTIADCGYTLQDGVASLFPSLREALRALSSTGLSVVIFVWLELKKSFTSVVLLLKD